MFLTSRNKSHVFTTFRFGSLTSSGSNLESSCSEDEDEFDKLSNFLTPVIYVTIQLLAIIFTSLLFSEDISRP